MCRKIFKGESVSTGLGIGEIVTIKDMDVKITDDLVEETEVENQITSLEVAICKTFIEIYDLKDGFKGILSEEENRIFDFYKEVLDDKAFFEDIKSTIKQKRFYARKAIHTCIQKYIDEIKQSDNEYIKERIHDLNDIRRRLIKNISSNNEAKFAKINSSHIVVVEELTPIIAAMLSKKGVQGVVAYEGAGYFTHAAIILRSIGIPTLGAISFEDMEKLKGKIAIIDCFANTLVVNPNESEIINCKLMQYDRACIDDNEGNNIADDYPVLTSDRHRVSLSANISNVKEFSLAKKINISGIGLVRTESLFINYKRIPDEKRQFLIYSKMAKDMGNKPVVIRTADIGGDKMPGFLGINPESLRRSSRGIKRSLEQKQELMAQIRSILRASGFGNVSITFPMVNTAEEIKEVKALIKNVNKELSTDGAIPGRSIRIGAVVETKSAVDDLEAILKEVDFISIGTNDLLHQICDLSRKCSTLEKRSYLEPELLKTIKYCIDKAIENNKTVSICGEMAIDPLAAVVLVGMGAHDLSMSPASVAGIDKFIREISFKEARMLADKVLVSESLEDVKDILSGWLQSRM